MPIASLRPFRHRRFSVLWSSGAVSNIGTWMETVAVGALVFEATGQAAWATLVAAATFLPIGLLGPLGGALADRMDRRRFMIGANAFEAVVASALAILAATDQASPGIVVGLVFVGGCSSALRNPFQQSVLPDLVSREDVYPAIALGAAQYNLGRVAGPVLAALVVAIGGFSAAFAVNAISFLAVIAAWLIIGPVPRAVSHAEGVDMRLRSLIKDGARTAWAEPGCRAAILIIGVSGILISPFIALIPAKAGLIVGRRTGALASAIGLLTTAQGAGALIGAFTVPILAERFGHRRAIISSLVAAPVAYAAFGLAPNLVLATAAMFVLGINSVATMTGLSSVVQLRAPAVARARVLSLFFVALGVFYPIGAVIQGTLADRVGFGATTAAASAGMVVFLISIALLRPAVLRSLTMDAPAPPAGVTPHPGMA